MATTPQKSDTKQRRGRGRPRFQPTAAMREQVMTLAGYGIPIDGIALLVKNPETGNGISINTLKRYFEHELAAGKHTANSMVVQSLYTKATGKSPQAVQAAIWWTKAQMGWRGTDRVEHSVPEGSFGVLVAPATISPSAWIDAQNRKNAAKPAPSAALGDDD